MRKYCITDDLCRLGAIDSAARERYSALGSRYGVVYLYPTITEEVGKSGAAIGGVPYGSNGEYKFSHFLGWNV